MYYTAHTINEVLSRCMYSKKNNTACTPHLTTVYRMRRGFGVLTSITKDNTKRQNNITDCLEHTTALSIKKQQNTTTTYEDGKQGLIIG